MKNIGLFGGTFDPVHNGHLYIARAFADEINLESVIFLPAGSPYHKPFFSQTSPAHRLAMLELAVEADPRFAVSNCDIVRQGPTYTFDTIQIFRQQFPSAVLWWLLGSDSLMQLHTWKKWQTLVSQIRIAVAMRPGDNLNKTPKELQIWLGNALHQGCVKILKSPLCGISSTQIRQQILNHQLPDDLIPTQVRHYIHKHGLYREQPT